MASFPHTSLGSDTYNLQLWVMDNYQNLSKRIVSVYLDTEAPKINLDPVRLDPTIELLQNRDNPVSVKKLLFSIGWLFEDNSLAFPEKAEFTATWMYRPYGTTDWIESEESEVRIMKYADGIKSVFCHLNSLDVNNEYNYFEFKGKVTDKSGNSAETPVRYIKFLNDTDGNGVPDDLEE